jgi:hypothetical protein
MADAGCKVPQVSKITVNGKVLQIAKRIISYADVLDIGFVGAALEGRSPTLRWSAKDGRGGAFKRGQYLTVSDGMEFVYDCTHSSVVRGEDIPRRYGSYRSQVCQTCGWFRATTHHDEPHGPWRPPDRYAAETASRDEE